VDSTFTDVLIAILLSTMTVISSHKSVHINPLRIYRTYIYLPTRILLCSHLTEILWIIIYSNYISHSRDAFSCISRSDYFAVSSNYTVNAFWLISAAAPNRHENVRTKSKNGDVKIKINTIIIISLTDIKTVDRFIPADIIYYMLLMLCRAWNR